MIITTLGCVALAYTVFIRPFTTDTKFNDPRLDNTMWYIGSFAAIIIGLMLGI